MNPDLVKHLKFSLPERPEEFSFPESLMNSIQIITNFFASGTTNKLCIVFPSKQYAAQWLSVPMALALLESDFTQNGSASTESYKQYKRGDFLKLNNRAIVEWVGYNEKGIQFITAEEPPNGRATFTMPYSIIEMLQPLNRIDCKLSLPSKIKKIIKEKVIHPVDNLFNIYTSGNFSFQKNSLCLVSKILKFNNSFESLHLQNYSIREYFEEAKLDDNGRPSSTSPLIISKNLSNLILNLIESDYIRKIIIDGFSYINERGTDFSDIDTKNIPTILITDLSEIDSFENIGNYGFEFFNFTNENLKLAKTSIHSPFHLFEKKLDNYLTFNITKEICNNTEFETLTQKIYSIEKDESNHDLNSLKISLIKLTNIVSRIAHIPTVDELSSLFLIINNIELLFMRSKRWLGDSHIAIEESIFLLKSLIEKFASEPSEKCIKLKELLNKTHYDYIICPTENEAITLDNFLKSMSYTNRPKVISIADVNDNILSLKHYKVIMTGWAKVNNMNRILYSFLFPELTVLFYQFEEKYYNSMNRRNKQYVKNIGATINDKGCVTDIEPKGFENLFSNGEIHESIPDTSFDIVDFELKLDLAQYFEYTAKGNLIDSIKAKRIDFESDFFIYSSESHKLLVINELIEIQNKNKVILRNKVDELVSGDIIAFIITDRDILVELVEKNTNTKELAAVKQWTELWKNLLKEHYKSVGNNFKLLVKNLRDNGCKKQEITIKAWLQDEGRIGPDDDADLINIAVLTNSTLLYDNIKTVRESIRKMKGWRMKASDFITEKIKSEIHKFANSSIINKKISIEGLGSVIILKVVDVSKIWENIDVKFVNRLLQKSTLNG